MHGAEFGNIPRLTLTDSKGLSKAIHNIKSPGEKRIIGDILKIKQTIAIDKIITEARHVSRMTCSRILSEGREECRRTSKSSKEWSYNCSRRILSNHFN